MSLSSEGGEVLYPRDASWQNRPSTSPRHLAFHRPSAADEALAACSRRIMLNDDAGMERASAGTLACKRLACSRRQADEPRGSSA